jgi:hypothetical protein
LQSDCSFHARDCLRHLQRHKTTPCKERSACVGQQHQDLATNSAPLHRRYLTVHVYRRYVCILERRPSESREGGSILYRLRRRLLHLQHRHVGSWRRCLQPKQSIRQQQRHVGLVLRRQQATTLVRERRVLCACLPSSGRQLYISMKLSDANSV